MGQMPNMFGGFGAGGMGMNDMSGMNMGMGFGGGFGGNWNGQQQGMGGNFGAGYYPNAGYNQPQMHQGAYGNGNQMHNQHFPNHNYQNRFQGQRGGYNRGRGGFGGRGGHHVNQFQGSGPHHPHNPPQYATPQAENNQLPDGVQGDPSLSQALGNSAEPSSEKHDEQSAMPVDDVQVQDMPANHTSADVAAEATNIDGQVPLENGHGHGGEYQGGDDMRVDDNMQQAQVFGGELKRRVNRYEYRVLMTIC